MYSAVLCFRKNLLMATCNVHHLDICRTAARCRISCSPSHAEILKLEIGCWTGTLMIFQARKRQGAPGCRLASYSDAHPVDKV
jgi:hypothetical protein